VFHKLQETCARLSDRQPHGSHSDAWRIKPLARITSSSAGSKEVTQEMTLLFVPATAACRARAPGESSPREGPASAYDCWARGCSSQRERALGKQGVEFLIARRLRAPLFSVPVFCRPNPSKQEVIRTHQFWVSIATLWDLPEPTCKFRLQSVDTAAGLVRSDRGGA